MPPSNEATPFMLDPISAQIIRQHLIHTIERISDEDLEEPVEEPVEANSTKKTNPLPPL